MMRVLIDTHVFLWFITDDPRLSDKALAVLKDVDNKALLSMASLWEIAIKVSLGKLDLSEPFEALFPKQLIDNQIASLPIELSHVTTLSSLPFHHRDPFDRLIVAQAMTEGLPVLSRDAAFGQYPVRVIW